MNFCPSLQFNRRPNNESDEIEWSWETWDASGKRRLRATFGRSNSPEEHTHKSSAAYDQLKVMYLESERSKAVTDGK